MGRRHWLTAFLVALIAHASLLLVLWKPAESGAASLGVGGMEISFGMAGGAPGATEVTPPETQTIDSPETEPLEEPERAVEEIVETVEVAEPLEIKAIEPPMAETVPIAEVRIKTDTAKLLKKPDPPKEVKPVAPKPAPPKEVTARDPAPPKPKQKPAVAGAAGKSGAQQTANVGSAASMSSGGRPGSSKSYYTLLQAWLEKHKKYPASARRRRNEGTAVLTFTLRRDGKVIRANIARSSGSTLLDEEVMKMISRATPLPPFPGDFTERQMTLSVPIQFNLR